MTETRASQVESGDGHTWSLLASIRMIRMPPCSGCPRSASPRNTVLPLAEALAAHGVVVFVHEWRGKGSSNTRADRHHDWGYRELLTVDIPASEIVIANAFAAHPRRPQSRRTTRLLPLGLSPAAAIALWVVGIAASHFSWMQPPQAIANFLAECFWRIASMHAVVT